MSSPRLFSFCTALLVSLSFPAYAAAPLATTTAATSVSNTVATLNGAVNPGGGATTAWFQWGLYPAKNTSNTAPVSVGSGLATVAVSNLLTGLTPGLTYQVRLVASNVSGVVTGNEVRFGSPALTLTGAARVTNYLGNAFNDPGAITGSHAVAIAAGYGHNLVLRSDGMVAAWGANDSGQTTLPAGLSNVMAIAAGGYHSLALRSNGMVVAWGDNSYGQTTLPAGLSNVMTIAGGALHSLALRSNGTVVAWGAGEFADAGGSLGDDWGQSIVPAGLTNVVGIAAGVYHSVALRSNGTVVAWGYNYSGQTDIPAGLSNVVAIAGGGYHSLALRSGGTVVAWGANDSGQTTLPAGLSNVVAIAAGVYHNVALRSDGTVVAWGDNGSGQTTLPAGLSNVVAIAAGDGYSLALRSDGTVVAWGDASSGQTDIPAGLSIKTGPVTVSGSVDVNTLGTYTLTYTSTNVLGGVGTVNRTVVVNPNSPTAVTLAATSVSNTVATLNGAVNPGGGATTAWFQWGLYPAKNTSNTAPVSVGSGLATVAVSNLLTGLTPGLTYQVRLVASNVSGVVTGNEVRFGSPALTLMGAARVTNYLGNAFTNPGAITGSHAVAIAQGFSHSLALRSDGTVIGWGANDYGQTTLPAGLSNVVAIATGGEHSLALRSDGTVVAWGYNSFGQTTLPAGLSNVMAIAGGGYHSLALRSNGTVVAWGAGLNNIEGGGDNGIDRGQSIVPAGLSNVVAITGGMLHSLALKSDQWYVAWGDNSYKQCSSFLSGYSKSLPMAAGGYHNMWMDYYGRYLEVWGDNTYGQRDIPISLEFYFGGNGTSLLALAGGIYHSLALRRTGTVDAWGANDSGQTDIPAGLNNVVAIAAGGNCSLALRSDGTVVAWGDTSSGLTDIPAGLSIKTGPVTVSGSVDVNTPGTYTLTYTSTNVLGGVGTVNRTVVIVATATPPWLAGVNWNLAGNRAFQFSFTNAPSNSFSVLVSTNVALPLNQWLNLGAALENPPGQYQFTDLTATNTPQRYYRVRSP